MGGKINYLEISGKKYGKQLLNLCITRKLRILSGITRNLAYIGSQGRSPWVRNNLNTESTFVKSNDKPFLLKLYKKNINHLENYNFHNAEFNNKPIRYKRHKKCKETLLKDWIKK